MDVCEGLTLEKNYENLAIPMGNCAVWVLKVDHCMHQLIVTGAIAVTKTSTVVSHACL